MTLRNNLTPAQFWAHGILDLVKAGITVKPQTVARALIVLGDVV